MEQGISAASPVVMAFAMIASTTLTMCLLVAVSLAALCLLTMAALRGRSGPSSPEQAAAAFHALDIEAFCNLIDPAEEQFLRENLPAAKFREIKRQRVWAALLYTRDVGRSARALAIVGQTARRSSDPAIAASGLQVLDSALRLRLQTVQATCFLFAEYVLPGLDWRRFPPLVDQYRQSAETLLRLDRFTLGAKLMTSGGASVP